MPEKKIIQTGTLPTNQTAVIALMTVVGLLLGVYAGSIHMAGV